MEGLRKSGLEGRMRGCNHPLQQSWTTFPIWTITVWLRDLRLNAVTDSKWSLAFTVCGYDPML
jgi:hypothetical protein